MPSLNTVSNGHHRADSQHLFSSSNPGPDFKKFEAKESSGSARSASKLNFDKTPHDKASHVYKLRDFNAGERRANSVIGTVPENNAETVNFRSPPANGQEPFPRLGDVSSQGLPDASIRKRWGLADRTALITPLFPSLLASNGGQSQVSPLPWQSDCLRSLGIPAPEPRDLAEVLAAARIVVDVPRREAADAGMANATVTVDALHNGGTEEIAPQPGARHGSKLSLAMFTVADALGRACDIVYTSINAGVTATGRGCKNACLYIYGGCADLVRKAAHTRAATPADAAHSAPVPSHRTKSVLRGPVSAIEPKDILERQLNTLRDAYKNTAVMEKFTDVRITDRNLLYLIKPKAFRMAQDAANLGLGGPDGVSGALMRSLTTAADNMKDPLRALFAFGTESDHTQYKTLRDQYLNELADRHPDFEERRLRLRNFGDNRGIAELEANLESAREELGQRSVSDESLDIAGIPLIHVAMRDPVTQEAAVIDSQTGEAKVVGVTGRQLSDDIREMRKCLADMIAYLEGLQSKL